jgi:hypothetical protein
MKAASKSKATNVVRVVSLLNTAEQAATRWYERLDPSILQDAAGVDRRKRSILAKLASAGRR